MCIIICLLEPGKWENKGDVLGWQGTVKLLSLYIVGGFVKWLILLEKHFLSKYENYLNIYTVWLC